MEERLKQRLVGAVVLVSLAVVFIPILFDMPPEVNDGRSVTVISEIPERPRDGFESLESGKFGAPQTLHLDTEVERERNRDASSADASVAESASVSSGAAAPAAATSATERPASGTRTEPARVRSNPAPAVKKPDDGSARKPAAEASATGGWTVQLGSFQKAENAQALRKRLQARGYRAFVESGSSAQGNVSRVFVGPMPDRAQATNSVVKLRRDMELEGIVVPYPGG